MRQRMARQAHHAHQVLLDGTLPCRVVELGEQAQGRRAVIVDQDVQAPEVLACTGDDALAIGRGANVGRHGKSASAVLSRDLCNRLRQRVGFSCHHGHVRTLGSKQARDGESDALARPADDRDLATESQIHRGYASRASCGNSVVAFSTKSLRRMSSP